MRPTCSQEFVDGLSACSITLGDHLEATIFAADFGSKSHFHRQSRDCGWVLVHNPHGSVSVVWEFLPLNQTGEGVEASN